MKLYTQIYNFYTQSFNRTKSNKIDNPVYIEFYQIMLEFIQEINKGYWNIIITKYYYNEYGNGLGPKGTEQILKSMLPEWWIEILPKSNQEEINNTLREIKIKSDIYAKKREDIR